MGWAERVKQKLIALGLRESDEELERREIQRRFRDTTGFTKNFTKTVPWDALLKEGEPEGKLTSMYNYKETPPPLNFPYVEVTRAPQLMQNPYADAETYRETPITVTGYAPEDYSQSDRRHEQEHINQQYSGVEMNENYAPEDVKKFFKDNDNPMADYLGYRFTPSEMAAWQAGNPGPDAGWDNGTWESMARSFIKSKGSKTPEKDLMETVVNRMRASGEWDRLPKHMEPLKAKEPFKAKQALTKLKK